MSDRLIRDNILVGIIIGWISIGLDFLVLFGLDHLIYQFSSYGHLLNTRRFVLIILAINIIIFRFMMVKWNRIQTGKGLFITIITATLIYIFQHKTLNPL